MFEENPTKGLPLRRRCCSKEDAHLFEKEEASSFEQHFLEEKKGSSFVSEGLPLRRTRTTRRCLFRRNTKKRTAQEEAAHVLLFFLFQEERDKLHSFGAVLLVVLFFFKQANKKINSVFSVFLQFFTVSFLQEEAISQRILQR